LSRSEPAERIGVKPDTSRSIERRFKLIHQTGHSCASIGDHCGRQRHRNPGTGLSELLLGRPRLGQPGDGGFDVPAVTSSALIPSERLSDLLSLLVDADSGCQRLR